MSTGFSSDQRNTAGHRPPLQWIRHLISIFPQPAKTSAQRFSQFSATFAARKIVELGIFGVRFGDGFTYSQTISPAGVTSKIRPFEPSQIRVFPLGCRWIPLM